MKWKLAFFLAVLGWAAIVIQFWLMMQNSITSKLETTVRFFSFFTILTNILVALFFTLQVFKILKLLNDRREAQGLSPITVYITVVGLVYQILLRHTWSPTGIQMIVDETLHSVIPVLTIIYWYLYESKSKLHYNQIPRWMLFPLTYLIYILVRGNYSGFYPYPFVNVTNLGLQNVLINATFLLVGFTAISFCFVWVGKFLKF